MRAFHIILIALSCLFAGCGSKLPAIKPYKMDIQQGNVVTSKMLLQLRPGMTKSQVRYIMGTPLIVDSFHDKRWDYFYQMRSQGKVTEKRRVILDFDKDLLVSVRGDVVPEGDPAAEPSNTASASTPKSVTAPTSKNGDDSWLDKLMFWKSTDKVVDAKVDTPKSPDPVAAAATPEASSTGEVAELADAAATESILVNKSQPSLEAIQLLPPASQSGGVVPAELNPGEAPSANVQVEPTPPAAQTESNPVVASKSSDAATADTAVILEAVNAWADAWRTKDIQRYLASYAERFVPDGLPSKKSWVAQRKKRLSDKQGQIDLSLEKIVIQRQGNQATVEFLQKYRSKVYEDAVTKQLKLELDEKTQRWQISRESVVVNPTLSNEQTVLAPEGTGEHLEGVIEKIGF